jgi:hypothetical protein
MRLMTQDDARFLAAAESASAALCERSRKAFRVEPRITLSYDEFTEIAVAFDRAVRLAVDAHLEQSAGRR